METIDTVRKNIEFLKYFRLLHLLAEEYGVVPPAIMREEMYGMDDIIEKVVVGDVNEELLSELLSRYQGRSADYMTNEVMKLIDKF